VFSGAPALRAIGNAQVYPSGTTPEIRGQLSVTMPGDSTNHSYVGLIRAGVYGMGMGISNNNLFWIGNTTTGAGATLSGTPFLTFDSAGHAQFGARWSCNNVTPPARASVSAAATDLATTLTLVNQLRTALINCGICQ